MDAPEGFRWVKFVVVSDEDDRLPAEISCLVCRVCQAMVLQNDFNDYADAHRLWHEKLGVLFKDHAKRTSEPELDTPADWVKMDTMKGSKK